MRGYRTKKISLPGGRVIEIVFFTEPGEADAAEAVQHALESAEDPSPAEEPPPPPPAPRPGSPGCARARGYPRAGEGSARPARTRERRCPNCEWRHVGDFGDTELGRFDDLLNEGTETLLVALRDTTRANMEAAVERMIDAIKLDLIEPMDF